MSLALLDTEVVEVSDEVSEGNHWVATHFQLRPQGCNFTVRVVALKKKNSCDVAVGVAGVGGGVGRGEAGRRSREGAVESEQNSMCLWLLWLLSLLWTFLRFRMRRRCFHAPPS